MKIKPDIVYILGTGSKWYDNELRYSIRSVEKNLQNYGRIFVVGEMPKFLDTRRMIYIEAKDMTGNKLLNAMHKIRIACRDKRVSDKFILMNDDFFILRKLERVANFNMGTLKEGEARHKTKRGYYYTAIQDTIKYLAEAGIDDPLSFELHYPMMLDKEAFLEVTEQPYLQQKPILFRSVYGNLTDMRSTYREDVKLYDANDFSKRPKVDVISTDNKVCLDAGFQFWIRGKFPKKAKCERI